MNVQGNRHIVVTTTVAMPPNEHRENTQNSPCNCWFLPFVSCFLPWFVLISLIGSSGASVASLVLVFCVPLCCCVVFIRQRRIAEGTEAEARLASARLGNLNLGVLRGDHQRAGRPQMISMAQQPSTAVVEREKRRTMLHYFDFRPPDEESAATAVIGCGISGSTTGLEDGMVDKEGAFAGSCIICFGDFTFGEKLCRLPCFHLYHAQCIDEWLDGENHQWCPLCKTGVLAAAATVRPATGSRGNTTSSTTPINITVNQEAGHSAV